MTLLECLPFYSVHAHASTAMRLVFVINNIYQQESVKLAILMCMKSGVANNKMTIKVRKVPLHA